ncbi:MAG: TolC family outer membrane protein [Gammaproteobacteria bacterium]|nr:TolC family outer membrane protein [Gammaproteobacteria bacterium]MCW5584106.1 TolC family outer membrane protein [Gammaproteobacteria bacterium]
MIANNKWICSLTVTILMYVSQHCAYADTLRDIVGYTVHSNPEVRVAAKVRDASNEGVGQARSGYFPTLDVTAGYGRERADNINTNFEPNTLWRTDFGVTARQMIFDGFATKSEVARNKAKTNADAYKVWGVSEDTALLAVQAYLDVLRNEELVAVAKSNLAVHQRTFSMVRRLSEQGLGREADTAQTSGRVDLAKANLVTAQNNLQDAKVTFQKVTGKTAGYLASAPDVASALLPRNEQQAIRLALENHPILKSAMADIAEAKGQYEASKSKFYPRLDLVASGWHNHNTGGVDGPDDDRMIALQLQYNILQGGKDIARTRETVYNIQEACEIRNRTMRQVTESMKLSWVAYKNSTARIPLLRAHTKASILTTRAYGSQFQLGKRTILDVLDSQNEYYTSQQSLINERYALLFAKYRILNSMGRLVEHFNVPLPPEACVPYKQNELF